MANGGSKSRPDEAADGMTSRHQTLAIPHQGLDPGKKGQEFDTGLKSWLQVVGGFFIWFNSWCVFPSFAALLKWCVHWFEKGHH